MSSTAIEHEIARLKKQAEIAKLQEKLKQVKAKPLPGKKIKKAATKTKAASPTKTKTTKPKAATNGKKKVSPSKPSSATKKPKLTTHHIGPAAKGETIIFEKLVVEEGHVYIVDLNGEGVVDVKDYDFKGGSLQIIEKKK